MNSMNITIETYTTTMPANILPGYLSFPSGIYLKPDDTSSANIWSFWQVKNPQPAVPAHSETYRDSFIGILTDNEASKMKADLKLFKKRFNDDFARKNKILFGH